MFVRYGHKKNRHLVRNDGSGEFRRLAPFI